MGRESSSNLKACFLETPLAPVYAYFKSNTRRKNAVFGRSFLKSAKNSHFDFFITLGFSDLSSEFQFLTQKEIYIILFVEVLVIGQGRILFSAIVASIRDYCVLNEHSILLKVR